MTDDLKLPKPATALGARHSARTGSYFGYGFLGERFCCGLLGRIEVLIEAYRVTDDRALLKLAKNLFDTIDPLRFADRSWQRGSVGLRFTQLRLEAPDEVDLPGLPLVITSGRERTAAI